MLFESPFCSAASRTLETVRRLLVLPGAACEAVDGMGHAHAVWSRRGSTEPEYA